jgi:hypothetical protein
MTRTLTPTHQHAVTFLITPLHVFMCPRCTRTVFHVTATKNYGWVRCGCGARWLDIVVPPGATVDAVHERVGKAGARGLLDAAQFELPPELPLDAPALGHLLITVTRDEERVLRRRSRVRLLH